MFEDATQRKQFVVTTQAPTPPSQPESNHDADEPKVMVQPHLPSVEQQNTQNFTHLPAASWCQHFVAARGRDIGGRDSTCVPA